MHISAKFVYIHYALLISSVFIFLLAFGGGTAMSQTNSTGQNNQTLHRFMVLDPGHFHAALVFKPAGYEGVSHDVAIYAPVGEDFIDHMSRVVPFNTRTENPASWAYQIHLGPDFQERMLKERFGDVVVLSGKNDQKIDRINACVNAGFNVLADKPWIIEPEKLPILESVLTNAEKKGLTVYDIMTERFEVTSILQRLIIADKTVFGAVTNGTLEDPAVVKKSVHHLYKIVSGRPNRRPWWFFDTNVQGEGLVDVTTHLVDLVFWILYPERAIDCQKDVKVIAAKRWFTLVDKAQFEMVTGMTQFPPQFKLNEEGKFPYFCNGSFTFLLDNTHVQTQVEWNFQAPEGGGDTHYSIIKGSKSNIIILQGKEQNYKPELYVEPAPGSNATDIEKALTLCINKIAGNEYPGVAVTPEGKQWKVNIPEKYRVGHEAHFAQVTDAFIKYLNGKPMPHWEWTNMMAKYYVTTKALELCRKGK